ncbi:hypothetical protein D5086_007276 [Populus alba]|uniref:Uncharacterized protein n=1 Tax=Populus alba TaxID=43335 RepID=A0ACC4CQ64_POPAL
MGIGPGQVEPKWASVSTYCKKHGVNRGPVQCRKRWSNLAGDYKKIKEWEASIRDETESFWSMRNDLRRERKLPGFFDREVYDILDGGGGTVQGLALALAPSSAAVEAETITEGVVFDSGRSAAPEDGLFSDFEQEEGGRSPEAVVKELQPIKAAVAIPTPISEKQYQPAPQASQAQGSLNDKGHSTNPEMGSASHEDRKRKRSRWPLSMEYIAIFHKSSEVPVIPSAKNGTTPPKLGRHLQLGDAATLTNVLVEAEFPS